MLRRTLLIILCAPSLFADVFPFSAGYQSAVWNVKANPLECHLEHNIPGYGDVKFYQLSGYPETSELHVKFSRAAPWSKAEVKFSAPDWDNQGIDSKGWAFEFASNSKLIEFGQSKTRRMLNALVKGKIPTIVHSNSVNTNETLEAKVSSVNFMPAYQSYMACLNALVPVKFTEISRSSVYFTTASSKLDNRTQQWLDYVAEYAKELNVRRVDLGGYTDSVGTFRANHRLSTARVRNVKSYLISKGVPKNKILARVFGEHRPISDNRSPLGRAQNRRVTIRILP